MSEEKPMPLGECNFGSDCLAIVKGSHSHKNNFALLLGFLQAGTGLPGNPGTSLQHWFWTQCIPDPQIYQLLW